MRSWSEIRLDKFHKSYGVLLGFSNEIWPIFLLILLKSKFVFWVKSSRNELSYAKPNPIIWADWYLSCYLNPNIYFDVANVFTSDGILPLGIKLGPNQ